MKKRFKLSVPGITKSWWITLVAMLLIGTMSSALLASDGSESDEASGEVADMTKLSPLQRLVESTGLFAIAQGFIELTGGKAAPIPEFTSRPVKKMEHEKPLLPDGVGRVIMIGVGLLLIWLAIKKGFEPLLLLPIGFGGILANVPIEHIAGPTGFLGIIFDFGITNGLFPLFIFMGVGAMTDFGPLIANPKTALLGAAAQFGIFATLLGAVALGFDMREAASIGIIGGADGPTSIYVTSRMAVHLLGAVAVAAYSYMALVPIIQPPIMRLFTTKAERAIKMEQLRPVSKTEKIVFPLVVLGLCILLLPSATPLIGSLCFGNLVREAGVVERLNKTLQNEFINIVTILLGLTVGSKLSAEKFLAFGTLKILLLGCIAFCIGTAAGVLLAKLMNAFSKKPINPLIGSAGVSAVPMAARVSNTVGLESNKSNFLLMHAMGPNVAGVIGSAVAAGVLLSLID